MENNNKPIVVGGINLSARVRNPQFLFQIFLAVMAPILAYTGLTASDFSSWGIVFDTALDALQNPYMLGLIIVSVYNAVNDPTVRGLKDSDAAKTYERPKGQHEA